MMVLLIEPYPFIPLSLTLIGLTEHFMFLSSQVQIFYGCLLCDVDLEQIDAHETCTQNVKIQPPFLSLGSCRTLKTGHGH